MLIYSLHKLKNDSGYSLETMWDNDFSIIVCGITQLQLLKCAFWNLGLIKSIDTS